MGRSPCCAKEGLNRGAWTALEDKILKDYITSHGEGRWRNLPKKAGLQRCGKSCRLRWLNYLRPDIKRGNISPDEEELIIRLHKLLGNRWSLIAGRLPGRTDNEIKNYWNTNLSKKVHDNQHNSIFFTRNKQPNRPNESGTRKKAETFMSAPNMSQSQSPLKMESRVIRTKAIRCSKVLLNPQSQKAESLGTNTEAPAALTPGADSSLENSYKPLQSKKYDNGLSPIGSQVNIDNSSDSMTDFNTMGEFSLSDLLNSEFSDFCGSASNCHDDSNVVSTSPDQPLVFAEELLEDFWTAQANSGASNLNSFASFFESGGDWLGC